MAGDHSLRWLAVFLLLTTLPAAPQSFLNSFEESNSTANSGADTASGDIPDVTRAPERPQLRELQPEELGDIHLVRQRYMAAIREYQKIEHPSAAVWNKMGMAYQQMYGRKEAERCYKEAIKENPRNANYVNNLATIQDQMQDFGAAEKNYLKAIQLNPDSAVFYKNLGTNLLMQHEYARGEEAYRKAVSLNPKIFEDHSGTEVNDPAPKVERGTAAYFKAKICARTGHSECAITFLIKAFNEGSATVQKVNEEADFSSLQGTPALTRLLARQQ